MDEIKRCLDTYALVEIYLGNEKFAEYLNVDFIINDLTLAEFYGVLLREYGENEANLWLKKLERYALQVNRKVLIEAVKFRYEHKKQNISFFDAVGYMFSVKNGYYFVTGDKEFENLPNVEFKKK
ncbi:MAG: PIN domain-containing protein [Nanoarchaeota archaeon]|nr:PIN domain-containing protein [Nanoarchaeota archaeon]